MSNKQDRLIFQLLEHLKDLLLAFKVGNILGWGCPTPQTTVVGASAYALRNQYT